MKPPFYFLLLLFSLSIFSCQKDQESILPDTQDSKEMDLLMEATSLNKSILPSNETLTFIRRMQWASFIAGKVLKNDENSQLEILSLITGFDKTISLDVLLQGNVAPNFKINFNQHLRYYLSRELIPEPEKDKPGRPISRGSRGRISMDRIDEEAEFYINYLTLDNCTEFYFPLQLNNLSEKIMISTAHPLSPANSNTAYERFTNAIIIDGTPTITNETIINPGFLLLTDYNIIVARPYRIPGDIICDYENYSDFEFTDFLNN